MLDTLKTLCYLSGVSGFEDEVRDYILERVLPHAESISTDPMGNLIVFKKGTVEPKQKIMVCAHMDEVGLIVMGITDEGYLRFGCVGGIDRRVLIGKKVYVGTDRIPGIIGIKAIHQTTHEEEGKVPDVEDLYIDIGCYDKESAEKLAALGDFCCFDDTVVEFGNGWLKAKAIDDRVGCAAMVKLIESPLPCDAWFVFSVQEEIGARGAGVAAHRLTPDISLVLEGTTATDVQVYLPQNVFVPQETALSFPLWTAARFMTRKCMLPSALLPKKRALSGRPRPVLPAAQTATPSSAPVPEFTLQLSAALCAISILPPAC